MKQRMGDLPWNFSEEDMAKLYPELSLEERAEAAENLSRYFQVVGKIHDRLDDEGKLKDVLLRIQYEKRNRKPSTTNGTSNPN
jgi:DNA-binding TFAR19-related protein (PDSD5 family)